MSTPSEPDGGRVRAPSIGAARPTPEWWAPALVLCLAASAWIGFRLHTGMTLEDALITFRYAENLASGGGFAFNPGEPVLGTTTPLFTLILAGIGLLFGPSAIPSGAFAISVLAGIASGAITWLLLREWGFARPLAGFTLAAFALGPTTIWTVAGGMETPLVVLFMAAGTLAVTRERGLLAAAACALLVLTRIDGSLFAGVLLGALLWRAPRQGVRAIAAAAALLLPWLVYATSTFGSPIPHSVIAKRAIVQQAKTYQLLDPEALRAWLDWAATYWSGPLPSWPWIGSLAALLGGGIIALRRDPRDLPLAALAVFSLALPAVFYIVHAPRFEWYLAPVVWSATLVAATTLREIGPRIGATSPALARAGSALLAVLLCAGLASGGIRSASSERLRQQNEDGLRRRVGVWLDQSTPADASVAMEAIGYQGTHARRRVIDLAGLVSPEVVAIAKRHGTNADRFERLLSELRPDFLVLRSFEVDENRHFHGGPLLASDAQREIFAARYREVQRFEAPHAALWGSKGRLTVYARRDPGEDALQVSRAKGFAQAAE